MKYCFLFSLLFICIVFCQPDTVVNLLNTERGVPSVPIIPSYAMTGTGSGWTLLNGGIYGYVIEDGDPYNVTFRNSLANNESTIIHAHGMTPPNDKDGVAYLVAPPIPAGDSVDVAYNLTVANRGTYWIHSHFGFQLGSGLAAPLIVKGNDPNYPLYEDLQNAVDVVMMLQDVCPYTDDDNITCDPQTVLDTLHKDFNDENDGEVESCPGIEPADDTDVMFVDFLANGRNLTNPIYVQVEMNSTVRLRVINAGSMTNYLIIIPDIFNATLVTVDGQYIKPFRNNSFWIAVSQRLDILLYAQQVGVYPILAVTETVYDKKSKQTGIKLQVSTNETTEIISAESNLTPGMMADQMEQYLEAFHPLSTKNVTRVINIDLTGDNGFMSINNRSYMLPPMVPYYPNPFPYYVVYGDRVIIKMVNRNPDSHAMHLHGHTFQILEINGKNISGAMRDVVLVPGGCGTATIAFDAVNPGKWLFHCHFEFHMMAGMVTTIEYTNATIPPQEGTTLTIEQNESAGVSLLSDISGLFLLLTLFVLYL